MNKEGRYTRLKSIEDFGVEVNWEELSEKNILIIGVGGIGSLVAEMLARCGAGELALIDLDDVEEVNLNRLFFTEEHIGLSKVEASKLVLSKINKEVKITTFKQDVCSMDFEERFENLVKNSDLAVSCLDNLPARLYVNEKFISLNASYIDTGAMRSGLGGYVHLVIPFETACYSCTGSVDTHTREKGESCTASLPSTIAIISSLASEICLKYLLKFGTIPDYIGFNALTDIFSIQKMQRDPKCFVCGSSEIGEKEKNKAYKDIQDLTEEKSLGELIGDLEKTKTKND